MATLQTRGFQLSALPRSPNVPANIGNVDVKAIYDGVKQGLATYEMARQAPQSMALADAQMQAALAEAPMKTTILAEQVAHAPMKTAILASEASPEMQEAKRQSLLSRSTKSETGAIQTARALVNAQMRLAEDPNDAAAAALVAVLSPVATKLGATSLANPQGVIDQRAEAATAADATKRAIAEAVDATKRELAASNEQMKRDFQASEAELKRELAALRVEATQRVADGRIAALQSKEPAEQITKLNDYAEEAKNNGNPTLEKYYRDAIARFGPVQKKLSSDADFDSWAAVGTKPAATATSTPTPATPKANTKEVTLPNGKKVTVTVKP